jgi:hypothetical protein
VIGLLVCALVALASVGCKPAIRSASSEIPRAATPALVDTGLEVFEEPETRQRLADVLGTPEMQRAFEELAAGFTRGALQGLSSEETAALVARFTSVLVESLSSEMDRLGPALARLSEPTEKYVAGLTAAMVRAASDELARSMGPAMRTAITEEIGPALRQAMAEDLGPGLAAMLRSAELNDALGGAVRVASRQAVLGSNDALADLAEHRSEDRSEAPLGAVGQLFTQRTWLLPLLITAAIFSIPVVWLLRDRAATKRARAESDRRAARAGALLAAMELERDGGRSSEVLALLRRELAPDDVVEEGATEDRPRVARRPPRPRPAT